MEGGRESSTGPSDGEREKEKTKIRHNPTNKVLNNNDKKVSTKGEYNTGTPNFSVET